ncbi:hypothetical protein GCM10022247_35530 [Allokutzneria multivorans]|uniref:Uncharacterized protein n=1 Tax=Allokutzneria multivorans TaxID=1142134 RepID=A0ABP7SDU4_9PSEU
MVSRAHAEQVVDLLRDKGFVEGAPMIGSGQHVVVGQRFTRPAGRGYLDSVELHYEGRARAARCQQAPAIVGLAAASCPAWRVAWSADGPWDLVLAAVLSLPPMTRRDDSPVLRARGVARLPRHDAHQSLSTEEIGVIARCRVSIPLWYQVMPASQAVAQPTARGAVLRSGLQDAQSSRLALQADSGIEHQIVSRSGVVDLLCGGCGTPAPTSTGTASAVARRCPCWCSAVAELSPPSGWRAFASLREIRCPARACTPWLRLSGARWFGVGVVDRRCTCHDDRPLYPPSSDDRGEGSR